MISYKTFYRNKNLFKSLTNSSSLYTALSDNTSGHLWANKLLIACRVIKVILFYI